jgi:hypothetical protein
MGNDDQDGALRASRARVVAAADEERRRVERSLHDGVQQHLVALAVNIQLVRQLAEADPTAAQRLLDEMARDVHEALESVRTLAHTIYPPLLVDRGLAEALRAAALEAGGGVRLDVTATGRYDGAAEAAVYFGCVESLAEGASVRVWEGDGHLCFEVAGDNVRLDEASTAGDRAGALDGTIEAEPGRVSGRVPLRR